MRTIELAAILLLASCASPVHTKDFDSYVQAFEKATDSLVGNVDISFGQVHTHPSPGVITAGECRQATWRHQRREVVINQSSWTKMSKAEREILIFHELGHCVLGLEHSSSGYMQAVVDSTGYDKANWTRGLEE